MSKEEKARDGAQAVVPDDEILDVALVQARGAATSGILGAVVGMSGNRGAAWGFAGAAIGQRINASSKGVYPTYVLAVSATKLYVLGRHKSGSVGGWKKLEPVAQIDRTNLAVARQRHGTVSALELTDTSTGSTLEFEPQHIGGLGLKDLLASLGE
ncbi:MAG: hypothetical protein ABWY55_09420 [Microbacterium sp.]